jgi:hypothetical protein
VLLVLAEELVPVITFIAYVSLTYHWLTPKLEVECGPEIWYERPQVGVTWTQVAPAVLTWDTEDREVEIESRINAWLSPPNKAYARP